jgi:hypothetical protein
MARAVGTDPTGDHGLMLEVVFSAAGSTSLSPLPDGYTEDASTNVPYTIDNSSGSTSTVTTVLGYIRTE